MILSLFVYCFSALILFLLAKNLSARAEYELLAENKELKFWTNETIASILFFAFLCGVRYNVGVDNLSYIHAYETMANTGHWPNGRGESYEWGFTALAKLFTFEGFHYSFFMGFWAAVQIFFVYYAVRRDRHLLPYIAAFIILGPTFLSWTNGLRQCVAGCAFIFLVEFIAERKLMSYVIGVILCSLIHRSALLLLPFYWIFDKSIYFKNKSYNLLAVIACTLIGLTPTWLHLINYAQDVIFWVGYDDYASRLTNIINKTNEAIAWGPSRVGLYVLDLMALYLYPKFQEKYQLGKRYDIYFSAFFLGSCLFNLFANTSHIFLRPIAYFRDFKIIIVPVCLYYLYKERRQQWLFILMLCLAYFYTLYSSMKAFAGGKGVDAAEVYKFFFSF